MQPELQRHPNHLDLTNQIAIPFARSFPVHRIHQNERCVTLSSPISKNHPYFCTYEVWLDTDFNLVVKRVTQVPLSTITGYAPPQEVRGSPYEVVKAIKLMEENLIEEIMETLCAAKNNRLSTN